MSDEQTRQEPQRHQHRPVSTHDYLSQEFWEDLYSAADTVWSGNPNLRLVEFAASLAPGRALDVGCGEGADAIWLAERGWTVTAVDISEVALRRAGLNADRGGAGIAARISWQHTDLLTWEPPVAEFDLVSAQFLHLPAEHLEPVRERLAAAVRPGGMLLLVGHDMPAPDVQEDSPWPLDMFFTPEQAAAGLDPAQWTISAAVTLARPATATADANHHTSDVILAAVKLHS